MIVHVLLCHSNIFPIILKRGYFTYSDDGHRAKYQSNKLKKNDKLCLIPAIQHDIGFPILNSI